MEIQQKETESKQHSFKLNFGKSIRNELFFLDKNLFFTNHGSYGAVPKLIFAKRNELLLEMESSPDIWFRYTSFKLWNENRQALADYLGVKVDHLVLSENATDSINSIVKSIEFNAETDAILAHEYTYNAVLNALKYTSTYRHQKPVEIFKVPIKYPIESVASLLSEFEALCRHITIERKLKIRLTVLDHISSATATLFPIKDIAKVIRKYDEKSLILVDGAHAIGQTEINLSEFDCDYYVSNLHKWFLSPRGCNFLYFRRDEDVMKLVPNVISHEYEKPAALNFFMRGTRDNSSWFLVEDCIRFYEGFFGGLENVSGYVEALLDEATEMLTTAWKTPKIEMPREIEAPFMKLVKLPKLRDFGYANADEAMKMSLELLEVLFKRFKHDACVVVIGGEMYCRISGFVYNTIEDYMSLRDAILDLV